tara:strand:+ start:20054 stop:20284 length:231 start_codon:yes stop_codon:yes gene_type:complete
MTVDSRTLTPQQLLKVDLEKVKDRLPDKLTKKLEENPFGKLVGYKMVDGNQFGLVIDLNIGTTQWFFEEELSELKE